jgi:hypothetical protein
MATPTVQGFARKWAGNLSAATTSMKEGAMSVTESPGAKAAAAADRWAQGVQEALASGKFAQNVGSVTTDQWRNAFIKKGIPRVATGATEAIPVVEQFAAQLLPVTARAKAEAAAMPQGKGAPAVARMMRNYEIMSQFRFQRR